MDRKMIEDYSEEELKQLIKELREYGFEVKANTKSSIVRQEATSLFGGHPYISSEIVNGIYIIADFATDNYEKRESKTGKVPRTFKSKTVVEEKETEYRRIVRGILELLKPHYGKVGFDENPGWKLWQAKA